MSVTENEAKTKWCPMSRVLSHTSAQDGKGRSYEGGYSWNRAPNTFDPHRMDDPPYTPGSANCIGSACMMWRREVGGMGNMQLTGKGYCGLAGRPE